jgi:hypothetical protein
MYDASDGDFGDGIADHRRQQHATQSVAQGVAIATLKRFQRHFGTVVADLFNVDIFWFQQISLHSDFLSIPPARYTGKAGCLEPRNIEIPHGVRSAEDFSLN